jgi:hypothetical protein
MYINTSEVILQKRAVVVPLILALYMSICIQREREGERETMRILSKCIISRDRAAI